MLKLDLRKDKAVNFLIYFDIQDEQAELNMHKLQTLIRHG